MIERAFFSRMIPKMISRACCALPGPVDFRAARRQLVGELDEMFVEVVDRIPFDLGGGLPGRVPILVGGLARVAGDFVFLERGLDERAMPQVARDRDRVVLELAGGGVHELARTSAR